MTRLRIHREQHHTQRMGWLRATVLGANDGIVSTSSLIAGVAASGAGRSAVLIAAAAGLVAGAMSMAAGEYVSVSSQADSEKADLARESRELSEDPDHERRELAGIYVKRGLEPDLAGKVADQLMQKDALAAHARDELGISRLTAARPVQAAFASALAFSAGAILPLLMVLTAAPDAIVVSVVIATLFFLALLGAVGASAGGASMPRAVVRVTFWGALAMAVTIAIGSVLGQAV
jgi:VIT1/CCC1 family predicted Fe2+/Mn2+ transporter